MSRETKLFTVSLSDPEKKMKSTLYWILLTLSLNVGAVSAAGGSPPTHGHSATIHSSHTSPTAETSEVRSFQDKKTVWIEAKKTEQRYARILILSEFILQDAYVKTNKLPENLSITLTEWLNNSDPNAKLKSIKLEGLKRYKNPFIYSRNTSIVGNINRAKIVLATELYHIPAECGEWIAFS